MPTQESCNSLFEFLVSVLEKVLACSAGKRQADTWCAAAADITAGGQVGCSQQDASEQEEGQHAAGR